MNTVTVRLNDDEKKMFEDYAKLSDMPLSTLFKKTLEEKMEMEFDVDAIRDYEKQEKPDLFSHDELKNRLGL